MVCRPGVPEDGGEVDPPFFFGTRFEGTRHPQHGRFLRLERDRLVEGTLFSASTEGAETVATIKLTFRAARTDLRLTHAVNLDEESKARHTEAWPQVLAYLDELVAGDRPIGTTRPAGRS
jgi:uncharacterized protein YndB with AHSA1/START domain